MFYKHNKQLNNHDGVVQPEQDQTVNPPQSVGPPLNAYRANEHLPKHVFDALAPKSLWLLMAEYIEYYATPREQFIFAVMTGATSIRTMRIIGTFSTTPVNLSPDRHSSHTNVI